MADIKRIALDCGFELAGIASVVPHPDSARYLDWAARGLHGQMGYLADHRADVRTDPRQLLPSAKSMLCVGKLYNSRVPYSTEFDDSERAWISRYAFFDCDYHDVMRRDLERVGTLISQSVECEWRAVVDTAPLLERSYAHEAGLGWIGKNTCLINEPRGSWFFLGELLLSLELEPDSPPPDRCGTCSRCIDACPTQAIVPSPAGGWELDARRCISYFTIEHRAEIPAEFHAPIGQHVFGCDICQDVCPWNREAPVTEDARFVPAHVAPLLDELAAMDAEAFRAKFRHTPVSRAKADGFARNVAIAQANSRQANKGKIAVP